MAEKKKTTDGAQKAEKPVKTEKAVRTEKAVKAEKPAKAEKPTRAARSEKKATAPADKPAKVAEPAPDAAAPEGRTLSPEEAKALLEGRGRTHFEGLGDAWTVLSGMPPAAVVPQAVATVLAEGGTRPAWQWKRKGMENVLMAWPKDQPVRASVLMHGKEGEKLTPKNAVPLLEGLPNDLEVEEVHPWQSGLSANVAVTMIEGKNPMWFFDPLYDRDRDDLTPGVTHTFLLAALALGLRRALIDDLTVTQGPQFEAYAEAWLEANPGKTRVDVPPLKVSVAGKHMIVPGRNYCEYQVRAGIERIEEHMFEEMPVKVLYTSFPFENRPSMLLPIYASELTFGKLELKEGMEIDAYVWLQGRIIDFDVNEPEAGEEKA